MSETLEYSMAKPHEGKEQEESHGLSRIDRLKAGIYSVATEINQVESPYEDAAAMKAGDALMVMAEKGGKKVMEKYRRNRMQRPLRRMQKIDSNRKQDDFTLA